jgi:type II secretory pathway pseudopilin PulG
VKARRGFTYIEAVVIIAITLILASLAMPNLIAMKHSRDEWDFKSRLRSLALECRSRAIDTGDLVNVQYDKEQRTLEASEQKTSGENQPLNTLKIPDGIEATKFSAAQTEDAEAQWSLPFYPDGTSGGGGIEFQSDSAHFSVAVSRRDGKPQLYERGLPDLSRDHWKAGSYAAR